MKYLYLLVLTQICCASDSDTIKQQEVLAGESSQVTQHTKKPESEKMPQEIIDALDDETFAEMIRKPGAYRKLFVRD